MDKAKTQLLNRQLSHLRVQLLFAKLSLCAPDWRKLHFTPSYNKVYYICEGEGWIRVGNELLHPKPGELVFLPGGVEQSYSVTEGTPYTMYWCHFRSNVSFGRLFHLLGISNLVKVEDSAPLLLHFRELIGHFTEKGPTASIRIQAALLCIIGLFLDRALADQNSSMASAVERKLMDTLHYIDTYLASELTIEQLSHNAHFHPNYFIRVFKRHMGIPPMKYIHERRLEKAQQLLASTDLTVGEVANRTGFNDVSYFSAAFKKQTGVTPTDYRRLLETAKG